MLAVPEMFLRHVTRILARLMLSSFFPAGIPPELRVFPDWGGLQPLDVKILSLRSPNHLSFPSYSL